MKILHVTMGISPSSGGPTRSVTGICRALSKIGEDVTLYVLHGHDAFPSPCGVNIVYGEDFPLKTFASYLRLYNLVHLQGLWDPILHKIVCCCRRAHIPYIISPRGMLDPWALSVKKWKKKFALFLYQRRDLNHAVALHATAEMERDHIRALGFTQQCVIAPNGVDVPMKWPPKAGELEAPSRLRVAIFLSRLHPGKGLLTLAEAWACVKPKNWIMRIIGPDTYGHKAAVIKRIHELGVETSWHFEDALDDQQKWHAYRSADLLIHPSVSENFGITIAEALSAGIPAIATKGTPWKDLETYKCGWWIDQGVNALAEALRVAISLDDAVLKKMGENGSKLVAEKYAWPAIGKQLLSAYKQAICRNGKI